MLQIENKEVCVAVLPGALSQRCVLCARFSVVLLARSVGAWESAVRGGARGRVVVGKGRSFKG